MITPQIKPGTVEQFVYTWSSRNLDGREGFGFGRVSPGLAGAQKWLSSLDVTGFAIAPPEHAEADLDRTDDPGQPDPAGGSATSGENRGSAVLREAGRIRMGTLAVVFRKVSPAGEDAFNRPRHLVHGFLGTADDLTADLAQRMTDATWLTADQCPLDALPALTSLLVTDLDQGTPKAGASSEDRALVLAALARDQRVVHDADGALLASVLDALGPRLSPYLDVVPFLDRQRAVVTLTFNTAPPGPCRADSATFRPDEALGRLQEHVFGLPVLAGSPETQARGVDPVSRDQLEAILDKAGLRQPVRAVSIPESGSVDVVIACESTQVSPTLFLGLDEDDLRGVLANATSYASLSRYAHYLATADPSDLTRVWSHTSLAVIGFALLTHPSKPDLHYPVRGVGGQLQALVGGLLRGDDRTRLVAAVLNAAASRDRRALQSLTAAFAEHTPFLFDEVVPASELDDDQKLLLMRALPDDWLRSQAINNHYVGALRLSLGPARRRRGPLQQMRRLLP